MEQVDTSPVRIVEEVVSLLRIRAEDRQIALEIDWQGLIPKTIVGDPVKLRQILANLIGNAIKFTDRGSVRIAVS